MIDLLVHLMSGLAAFDISMAFDRASHGGLLDKLISYGISGFLFGLILSFVGNRRSWMILNGKSLKEHLVYA